MEMPAQGGHDKSSMKQRGHAVSHKRHGVSVPCWRERSADGVFLLNQSEAGTL